MAVVKGYFDIALCFGDHVCYEETTTAVRLKRDQMYRLSAKTYMTQYQSFT